MKIFFLFIGSFLCLFSAEDNSIENGLLYGVIIVFIGVGYIIIREFFFNKNIKIGERYSATVVNSISTNFEVLEKYRVEMRKIKIDSQAFRLSGLLHILTNKLSDSLQKNEHTIYYDVNNDVGRYILGDNDYLEQVLEILFKDILSLSTKSEISLKISISKNKFLIFEVTNKDGIMPSVTVKEYMNAERTLSSMNEKVLDFIKAKKIIEAMSGSMVLSSSRMSGTYYTFKIPYVKDEDNRSKQKELKKFLEGKNALFIAKSEHDSKRAEYIFKTFGIVIDNMNITDFEKTKPDVKKYDMMILRSSDLNHTHMSFLKNIYQDQKSDFKIIILHELFEVKEKIALSKEISHAELYNPTIIGDVEEILYQMFILKSNAVKGINNMEIFNPETFELKSTRRVTDEDFEKFTGAHVAIVEDSKVDQRIIRNILKIEGITLFVLNNGAEMLELLKNEEIDLIFSDINMPVMDGLTMAKKIREVQKWKEIPIISISSMSFVHEVKEMQNAGMNASIAKPIVAEEVYVALKRFLVISPKVKERRAQPKKISYTYNKNVLDIDKGIDGAGGQLQYIEILMETMEIMQGTTSEVATMIREEEYRTLTVFAKSALELYENIHAPQMVKMFRELVDYLSIKHKNYIIEYVFLYRKNWQILEKEVKTYLEDIKV